MPGHAELPPALAQIEQQRSFSVDDPDAAVLGISYINSVQGTLNRKRKRLLKSPDDTDLTSVRTKFENFSTLGNRYIKKTRVVNCDAGGLTDVCWY
jgi:hypothetical protein